VSDLSSTQGLVAIGAAAGAGVALIACALLANSLRRLRARQRVVLGEDGHRDLISHSAALDDAFEALRAYVEDAATRLDARLQDVETALRRAISNRALIRYDAYNEMSGRQSLSIALLDESQSGIVLSSIHHRDQARLYAKQVYNGHSELELSPEEAEALRLALSRDSAAQPSDAGY
jgi:hypothetical protein